MKVPRNGCRRGPARGRGRVGRVQEREQGWSAAGGRGKRGLPSPKSGLKSLKKIDISKIDLPKPEEAIDWVEEKAKGVGDAGYRVAELSSQARSRATRRSPETTDEWVTGSPGRRLRRGYAAYAAPDSDQAP